VLPSFLASEMTAALFVALAGFGVGTYPPDLTKIPCSTPVTYQAAFMSTLTEETHQGDLKSLGPDFVSSIVPRDAAIPLQLDFLNSARLYTLTPHLLVSHDASFTLWAPGEVSSPGHACHWQFGVFAGSPCSGIVNATLLDEVLAAGDSVLEYSMSSHTGGEPCEEYNVDPFNTPCVYGPRVVTHLGNEADPANPLLPPFGYPEEDYIWTIKVDEEHPYVSSSSMLGPSPDWGTGMSKVNLCVDGYWTHFTEPAYLYDAGAATGHTLLSYFSREPTSEPAFQITIENGPTGDDGTKTLSNADQSAILPLGQYLMEPLPPCSDVCRRRRSRELLFAAADDGCPFYCGPQPFSWYSTDGGAADNVFGRRK